MGKPGKGKAMAGLKRRDLLALGGLVALAVGWQVFGVRKPKLSFQPVNGAPQWRFASLGGVSGVSGQDFLTIGQGQATPPLQAHALWDATHRDAVPGSVPVAVFSDFFCPYCRGLIGRLGARNVGTPISITWHELPLLGPSSGIAAKASEAAALQGGYIPFVRALQTRGFRPVPSWMGTVATGIGLDGAQLVRDMEGPVVTDRLDKTLRIAARLGFYGTPGIVIGKSAILGALESAQMEDLIDSTAQL